MQLDGKELPERSGTSAKCPNKGNSELKGQKSASDQPKKPQDGFPSGSRKPEVGRQITLFELETLWALHRDHNIELKPEEHRRNVTVEGAPLNHLVGCHFWLGETLLEATRLSTPCRHVEEITGKAIFKPLINRSGLNCRILRGGVVRVGDTVKPE